MSGLVFDLSIDFAYLEDTTARVPGQDIFVDRNQSAQVVLGASPLKWLEIVAFDPDFQLGVHTGAGGVILDGEFEEGAKVYVDGEEIAVISHLAPNELSFTFTDKATAGRVETLIRALTFKDTTGSTTFEAAEYIDIYLTDTSDNTAYVWMVVGDTVHGTSQADVFTVTSDIVGRGDELDGGAGDDVLQLSDNGNSSHFFINTMSKLVGIETIQGSDSHDWIYMHGSQWADLERIDGKGGENVLNLHGSNSDLAHTEILNFEGIKIQDDNAEVRVASVVTALLVSDFNAEGEELVIESGTLNVAERRELHNRGIDTITTLEDGHTSVQGAAELLAFGDPVSASAGYAVFVDKDRDSVLDVTPGGLYSLEVNIDSARETETLGVVASDGLILTAGLIGGSDLIMRVTTPNGSMHDIEFGHVISSSGTGSNVHFVRFRFNENAKVEWVQQFIRSLTYKHSGETAGERKVTLTMKDVGARSSTAEVIINATTEPEEPQPPVNKAPADISLSAVAISENSTAGTMIGSLAATDEDRDPLTYMLQDDAGGRFEIRGDKLVVKDGSKLDFESASSHKITVKVSDGKAAVTKDFVIRVDDAMETVPGATRAKDILKGGRGADRLNGGLGNDTLSGDAGADVFEFTPLSAGARRGPITTRR
jgi:RTX calcium-binding nonapeptide repeat (4 copies)/Cadherin domain